MPTNMCALETCQDEGVLVAGFRDAKILDESTIHDIYRQLTSCLPRVKKGRMIIDFKGVSFMSSAMISKLVLFNKKCRASSIDLQLSNVPSSIRNLFRMTRLERVFRYSDDSDCVEAD